MRVIFAFLLVAPAAAFADDYSYGPPISQCLNKNTIPYINTDRNSTEIVSSAYNICAKEVSDWEKDREALPEKMRVKQSNELRDFYIHMIDKRREFNASKR